MDADVKLTFATELEALVDRHGRGLTSNQIISTLEGALSRAWDQACEPQPASLFATAPRLLEACSAAKQFLVHDLEEPGRTVFWKLVDAIALATGADNAG